MRIIAKEQGENNVWLVAPGSPTAEPDLSAVCKVVNLDTGKVEGEAPLYGHLKHGRDWDYSVVTADQPTTDLLEKVSGYEWAPPAAPGMVGVRT